jgi:DNA repair exonuclease SbcCD ATPase subunit
MRDVYAFALKLALSESLWDGELPFIVMDDPFTALDGERLERAKALVRRIAKEKQIIYFTCSKERAM